MKVLIDINHPAHVHFFKNIYKELVNNGHQVILTASLKEINYDLLRSLNIDFVDLGTYGKTPLVKMLNVPIMAFKMRKVVKKFKPEVLMGIASSRIGHATIFNNSKVYVFTDTEHAKEQILLFKPFTDIIITPECFFDDLGKTQVRIPSYHELAYLHPSVFTPNPSVLKLLNLKEGELFFIVRFVSWQASHDIGQKGLTIENKKSLIDSLVKKGKVFISDEGTLPESLTKYQLKIDVSKMHDLLYYSTMYIGEGGTMASEAAVLGTPSIFISTLNAGTFYELENKYKLMFSFKDFKKSFSKIKELLDKKDLKDSWRRKRNIMLNDKIDYIRWIVDFLAIK